MATVDLTVAADLSALRRQLETIPGLSADAATRMTAELNKSIKASEAAAKRAAAATKAAAAKAADEAKAAAEKATSAIERTEDAAGALGSNAGKLAGALDLLAPGLGSVATTVADLADAGEVAAVSARGLGASLGTVVSIVGPVAVAVAALGAAWYTLNSQLEEAEARNQAAAAKATVAAEAAGKWSEAQRGVADAFGLASGAIDKQTVRIRESNKALDAAAADQLAFLEEQKRAADAAAKAAGFGLATPEQAVANRNLKQFRATLEATKTQAELVITQEEEEARAALATAAANLAAANAARQRATDEASVAAALAAEEEQERKLLAQNAEYLGSLRSLQDTARAASESRLEGEAAVDAALQRQVEKVNEIAARQAEASMGNAAQLSAIEAARLDAVVALESEAAEKIDAIREDLHAKQTARNEREIAEAQSRNAAVLSSSGDLFAALASAAGEAADAQSKSSKDAAMTLYGVQKASAIVSAGINAALAVSQALGNLPPPASYIAAAASGVMGAAQVAAIASTPAPSFNDTPGVQQMTARGNVSLASGDFFAAARDPAELQRQVGAMASPGPVVLEMRLGHRVLDRSVAQTVRQGGRLSRELRGMSGAGPTGHAR
jgi:trimeric autotransporter adhesin